MKKREKSIQSASFTAAIPSESPPPLAPVPRVPQKVRRSGNAIIASSDSAKSRADPEPSKDLSLLLQKANDVPRSDSDAVGWKKIEFSLDHQMPICKDYLETGYCTFGSACKFLHTRDDVTTSADYERKIAIKALQRSLDEKKALNESAPTATTCSICHSFFKDPVTTKCGHMFCSSCATDRYRTTPNCAICGKNTNGIFNTVKK